METKKERVVFLSGQRVNLRPLDAETDLENVMKWINDQEVTEFMSHILPSSRNEEREWLNKKRENDVTLAIETKKGLHIGTIGLHQIDYRSGTAHIGIMIGDKNYWSKGFGFDAEMTLLNYGFNNLNLRKVMHCVFRPNLRSAGCAKKCGGIKEGIWKRHFFKNGCYLDQIFFAIFKPRWQKIWEEYYEKRR